MNADIVDLGLARALAAAGLLTGFTARPDGDDPTCSGCFFFHGGVCHAEGGCAGFVEEEGVGPRVPVPTRRFAA